MKQTALAELLVIEASAEVSAEVFHHVEQALRYHQIQAILGGVFGR